MSVLLDRESVTVDELADILCGWEAASSTLVSPERHQRVRIALHHIHLPHLANAELLEYDPQEGEVDRTSLDDSVQEFLRRSVEMDSK